MSTIDGLVTRIQCCRVSVRLLARFTRNRGMDGGRCRCGGCRTLTRVGLERYRRTIEELVQTVRSLARHQCCSWRLHRLISIRHLCGANPIIPIGIGGWVPHTVYWLWTALRCFRQSSDGNSDFYDQVHPSTSGHALLGQGSVDAIHDIEQ